jgi:hypothetical protein
MDHVILLHFSGLVIEQFELVGMRCEVLTFLNRPSFNDLVARVRTVMNIRCDMREHRCDLHEAKIRAARMRVQIWEVRVDPSNHMHRLF